MWILVGCGWWWGQSSKSQSIIGFGRGLEKKLKWLLTLLALDCSVTLVASPNIGLETLQWCHMSMKQAPQGWSTVCSSGVDGVDVVNHSTQRVSTRALFLFAKISRVSIRRKTLMDTTFALQRRYSSTLSYLIVSVFVMLCTRGKGNSGCK